MHIGLVGLGKMGANMRQRIRDAGIEVTGFDRNPDVTDVPSLEALVEVLPAGERIVWVMVPSGAITDAVIRELAGLLAPGDLVIDGGNSYFADDERHGAMLDARGVGYLDVGVSGGIWGLENGYGLMVGGGAEDVARAMPIFDALRPEGPRDEGFVHAGPVGAGHYAKMVHNGIEYGLMQAYAEGFDILKGKASEKLPEEDRFDIDLAEVAEVWRRGSVISSWLLDLCASALTADPRLDGFSGNVSDSGEGQWTIDAAMEEAVPAYVLSAALFARYRSRVDATFGDQLLSAMRFGFGGHVEMPQ